MSNYNAITRSNLFRVKDRETFEAWCRMHELEYRTEQVKDMGHCYAISAADPFIGWPFYDEEADQGIDIYEELARHLDNNDVAVLFEVGFEGDRYVQGFAHAIHADGRVVSLNLLDIYQRARQEFGKDINITHDRGWDHPKLADVVLKKWVP